MTEELKQIERVLSIKITNLAKDQECEEYHGYNFKIGPLDIKFRKAKITPKKTGQFVTLWKRNHENQTEPFHVNDGFEFYIVAARRQNQFGIFLFPKSILSQQQILTSRSKEGKRGFRLYPDWDIAENKQAEKTQNWQTDYFIDLSNAGNKSIGKFDRIITGQKMPGSRFG